MREAGHSELGQRGACAEGPEPGGCAPAAGRGEGEVTESPERPLGSAGRSGLADNSGGAAGALLLSCSAFHFMSPGVFCSRAKGRKHWVSQGKKGSWGLDVPHSPRPRICPCGAGELPGLSRPAVYISVRLGVYSILLVKFGGLFVPRHQPQHGRRHRAPYSSGYVRRLGAFISLYLDALGFSEGRVNFIHSQRLPQYLDGSDSQSEVWDQETQHHLNG